MNWLTVAVWLPACHAIIENPLKSNVSLNVTMIFYSQQVILIAKIKENIFSSLSVTFYFPAFFFHSCLMSCCILFHSKLGSVRSPEMSAGFYRTTRCLIAQYNILQRRLCENRESRIVR
jgi:hypothetical protein